MKLNVSEVQDFSRCQYRWWAKWVMNRVPRVTATPLSVGKLVHSIFETHLRDGVPMDKSVADKREEFLAAVEKEAENSIAISPDIVRMRGQEAVEILDGLAEALHQWKDEYAMQYPVVDVEVPFEWTDPTFSDLVWIGRPDRTAFHEGRVWHHQIKCLAPGVNFATFIYLQHRSYHEHLYAEALRDKYCNGYTLPDGTTFDRGELTWGGTLFTLVRKLKYRTNVTKANPEGKVKRLNEMFWQHPMVIDLDSTLHSNVMESLRKHAHAISFARKAWESFGVVPPPSENMNGGAFGNRPDEYFNVLIGDASLDNDELFMDREDTYNKENNDAEEVN